MSVHAIVTASLLAVLLPGCATLSFGAPTLPAAFPLPTALMLPGTANSVAAQPAAIGAKAESHWSYTGDEGPAHWGALSTDYAVCATGKAQTPINVPVAAAGAALPKLAFTAPTAAPTWSNNGHTLQMDYPAGGALTMGGQTYNLAQFHFHAPSEHTVNGVAFPMELHIVHKDAGGNLAVVGVLIQAGDANPAFNAVWAQVPAAKGATVALAAPLAPETLLPAVRDYYTYTGSLTTPPCTEGVRWLLMTQPVTMSTEQIATFTRVYAANNRPV